jgi:UDP-N-acetylglucosamine 2-epimerase (non-hydrolysing)
MRLIVVVGARPNFIKVAPLMPAFDKAGIDARIVHTGQHYDASMSDVFFADLDLPEPHWFLGVGSGTHAVQTGRAMIALEELLLAETPDALMVVGDVNSTLAGALAASKIGLPVVHLEAGLRSGDMSMPEEVNRLVTDQLSSMLLTPNRSAGDQLAAESIEPDRIRFVGNVMAESVLSHLPKIEDRNVASAHGLDPGSFALVTIHRPENTDRPERIAAISSALDRLEHPVLFPVHPRTRPTLEAAGLGLDHPRVKLVDPVGYLDMLSLEHDAAVIVTDSGGVQEEACVMGTPCVTVRRNTERQITIEAGANRLVDADTQAIVAGVAEALEAPRGWTVPERWDSEVSARVIDALAGGISPLAR